MGKAAWKGPFHLFAIAMLLLAQLVSGIGGFAGIAAADASQTGTGSQQTRTITVPQAIDEASEWIASNWDKDKDNRDWFAYTLAAAGKPVPDGYLASAAERAAALPADTPSTAYDRLALGVKAAGGNPASIAGVNLIEKIYNHPKLGELGSDGVSYGLILLNGGSYAVPADAKWTTGKMVSWLLQHQISSRGWAWNGAPDAELDSTGSALWALAPYQDREDVKAAITKATSWIASKQQDNGDLSAGYSNSNGLAMAILGLSALQIDGRTGQFAKANGNLISALFHYMNPDGGFSYKTGSASDSFSTYQALLALIAFNHLTGGQGGSYQVPLSDKAPQDKAAVFIHIEHKDTTLAEGTESAETVLEALQLLAASSNLPVETAMLGTFEDVTKIGTVSKYVYGTAYDYWTFNIKRNGTWTDDWDWRNTKLQDGDEIAVFYGPYGVSKLLDSIVLTPADPLPGEPFSVKVTQIESDFTGTNKQSVSAAVYVQVGEQKVWTGPQGTAAFPSGYSAADQRVVVTGPVVNGYPTVIRGVKSLPSHETPVPGVPIPSARTITVSVAGDEKLGTIIASQSLDWQNGDTAFSVLLRALGAGRVESKGSGSSAYVSGIDGLREFDKGPKSGWMYAVNCTFPSTSAGGYKINIGDRVDWRYTKDSGEDVKAVLRDTCTPPSGTVGNALNNANAATELENNLALIAIGYDNTKPADPKLQTVRVLNDNQKMTSADAQKLRQTLRANKVELERSVSAPDAADLTDSKEEVRLQIPERALTEDKQISIRELDDVNGREELVSPIYEFGPSGTKFDKPVYISIRTTLDTDRLTGLAMAWLNEETGQWIPIPAVIDAKTGIVTGAVDHFTKFAVIDKSKLAQEKADDVGQAIEQAVKYIQSDAELSDWEAYALATAGVKVPSAYIASAESMLKEKNGILRNVTDYERLAIGIKAAGGDPAHIAGYDLIKAIVNSERMTAQGTNGPIFALTVLGTGGYRVPADALWNEDKLIRWLLQAQNSDGGWPLDRGDLSNVDLTAMAIVALSPYRESAEVKSAIDKALGWLSGEQQSSGGFRLGGQENSESAAQVLLALVSLGIRADDPRFVKSGRTVVSELLSYRQADGGFAHAKGEASGSISTEQALLSLAAYQAAKPVAVRQAAAAPAFADAADISPWAAEYAKKAFRYGLMEGVSDKELRFAPREQLTRAQFVAMTLRLMGTAPSAEAKTAFADVQPGSWYAGYVAKAAELGIVGGLAEGTFGPERSMTRQDMALVLSRAFRLPEAASGKADSFAFADMNEAYAAAVPAIRSVFENGYMEGDDQGRFQPAATVTREMAAAVMVRIFEKQHK